MAKINQEWRSILRQVKIQDLRREIVDVEQFFKEALKRKDLVIKRLIGDINSTEDMYANLQQSHMENIDKITGKESRSQIISLHTPYALIPMEN